MSGAGATITGAVYVPSPASVIFFAASAPVPVTGPGVALAVPVPASLIFFAAMAPVPVTGAV